jgi:hypothetical protein
MSVELIIEPRKNDLGDNFIVRRALPYSKKRMVGPFIFLDHMGPAYLKDQDELKVRSHPHIGLSTITFLFSGDMLHRDSLGNELTIKPGEVNWMTAGRGIVHSERSYPQADGSPLEGIQAWIALPVHAEDIEPSFVHHDAPELKSVLIGGNRFTLIAGEALGEKSPVPVYSPLFYLHGNMKSNDNFAFDLPSNQEGAVYVAKGEIEIEGKSIPEGTMVVFQKETKIEFSALSDSSLMILGGEVFPEKRFVFWNFVSSSQEKIEAAKKRWREGSFEAVINETEKIPLPEE